MSILKDIEYKSPGADEWQCIEVVVDVVHNRMWVTIVDERERERRLRESARQAAVPTGIPEILSVMFGVPVRPEPPPVPPPRKSQLHESIIGRFARQADEARRQAGSRPGTPSAGSRAGKLAGLERLLRESRRR